jgi:electron transport complex protein RnfB
MHRVLGGPGCEGEGCDVDGATVLVVALFVVGVIAGLLFALRRPQTPPRRDALISAVLDALPGGNCGACGNDSCFDAAVSFASGQIRSSACVTGGEETTRAVEAVLGAHRS